MSDIRGKRILVVGGAGLIGSHIVDQLTDEDVGEVIVYDNFSRGTRGNLSGALTDPRVRIFDVGGDITQADILGAAVKEADMVVHLAALWLLQCHEYPRAAFDVNIQGTFNVLEACRDAQIERLVYSSSASVYGNAQFTPMTEDHPYGNETFYGATKIAGEHMCRAFYHRYGLSYAGLRYMNVYGPRQDYKGAYIAVIMKILDCIDRGERPVVYGDGTQSYDFVYVGDVARANICALKSDAADAFYNVGTGLGTSIRDLAEMLVDLTGSDLPVEYRPQEQSFVTHRIGSTEAAQRDLGFLAKTELAEGLERVIEWRKSDQARANAAAHSVSQRTAQNEPPLNRQDKSVSA
jgi:UDP-glucose 4-epimerase